MRPSERYSVCVPATMLDYRAFHALPFVFFLQSGREPLLQLLRFGARPKFRAHRDTHRCSSPRGAVVLASSAHEVPKY